MSAVRRRVVQGFCSLDGRDFITRRNVLESQPDTADDLDLGTPPAGTAASPPESKEVVRSVLSYIVGMFESIISDDGLTAAGRKAKLAKLVDKYDSLMDGLADEDDADVIESFRERIVRVARTAGVAPRRRFTIPRTAADLATVTSTLLDGGGQFAPGGVRCPTVDTLEQATVSTTSGKPIDRARTQADLSAATRRLLGG